MRTLTVAKATVEELKRNYTCYARNAKGEEHSQAVVHVKGTAPVGQGGCSGGLLLLPWALPRNTVREQRIPSGLSAWHSLFCRHCCGTAPQLGGREQRALPQASSWKEKGQIGCPYPIHVPCPSAQLTGQAVWNDFRLFGCVRVLHDTTAASWHPPEDSLHSLALLREWDIHTTVLSGFTHCCHDAAV